MSVINEKVFCTVYQSDVVLTWNILYDRLIGRYNTRVEYQKIYSIIMTQLYHGVCSYYRLTGRCNRVEYQKVYCTRMSQLYQGVYSCYRLTGRYYRLEYQKVYSTECRISTMEFTLVTVSLSVVAE